MFLLKLNSGVPWSHIAFYLNPQRGSHLSQFFPDISSFPVTVTPGKGPAVVKCVTSGRICCPKLQIIIQVFALSYFAVRDLGQVLCVQVPLQCLFFTEGGQTKRGKGCMHPEVAGISTALPVGDIRKSTSRNIALESIYCLESNRGSSEVSVSWASSIWCTKNGGVSRWLPNCSLVSAGKAMELVGWLLGGLVLFHEKFWSRKVKFHLYKSSSLYKNITDITIYKSP